MSEYAIGDIQGCFEPFMRLLNTIEFNEKQDRLWFVGDLVNRGPQSLEVLQFIKNLPIKPRITLGNHDLHLLAKLFVDSTRSNSDDTLDAILRNVDKEELGFWLRQQSLLYYDESQNCVLCHAGIAPLWTLDQARNYAKEVESALKGEFYLDFLSNIYGNEPDLWTENLKGMERLRTIINYFTRMRFCSTEGRLMLHCKGSLVMSAKECIPWYLVPNRPVIKPDIIFGHWAALRGICPVKGIHALDTGCLWGGELTALRLQDKRRFSVKGLV